MDRKQIKFFFHLINKYFKQMNVSAKKENYKNAIINRDNINEIVKEMRNYISDMGYNDLETIILPETITNDDIKNLLATVNSVIKEEVDPIKNFVDRLESGESLSEPSNMQFYNNNRMDIESEMRKRSI